MACISLKTPKQGRGCLGPRLGRADPKADALQKESPGLLMRGAQGTTRKATVDKGGYPHQPGTALKRGVGKLVPKKRGETKSPARDGAEFVFWETPNVGAS